MNILKIFNSNKGISTPILLLSVVSIVIIAGGLIVFLQYPQTDIDKEIELNSTEQIEQIEQTKGTEQAEQTKSTEETEQAEQIKPTKQTETEMKTDGTLAKIKNNLKNVKSVHIKINEERYTKTSGQPISKTLFGSDKSEEYDFVFPNKKQRFFTDFLVLEGEAGAVVIDNNIYLNLKPVGGFPLWFLGKDGQQSVSFFDGPIVFNLTDFPEAWDFTKYAESIEEDLGDEEVNGIKCHHYKIKFKKIPGTFEELKKIDNHFFKHVIGNKQVKQSQKFSESRITEIKQEKNTIKFSDNNKEISIPIYDFGSIKFPFTYIGIGKQEIFGDTTRILSSCWYAIKIKNIEGEIWVGKNDLFVYKENYTLDSTGLSFNPNTEKKITKVNEDYDRHVYDIVYSNFNKNITIEHPPAENVITTIEEFLNYSEQFEPPEPSEPSESEKQEARDNRRKSDIRQIATALELFHSDAEAYVKAANMPSSIPVYMSKMPKDPVSGKDYKWIDNTKDSSKFCVYAELEQGGYFAMSLKGVKILNSPPENLSCW